MSHWYRKSTPLFKSGYALARRRNLQVQFHSSVF
jgi:hypothetical protein